MKRKTDPMHPPERLFRLTDLRELTGLSRSGVYSKISQGTFPRPLKSGRVSVWKASAIREWQASLEQR